MNLKEVENLKVFANILSFCLVIFGLTFQSYLWLVAAIALRSTTVSVVVHHKKKEIGGYTENSKELTNQELQKFEYAAQSKVRGRL